MPACLPRGAPCPANGFSSGAGPSKPGVSAAMIDRGNDFYDKTESKSRRRSDTDLAQLGQGRRPLELIGHALHATHCIGVDVSRTFSVRELRRSMDPRYDPLLIRSYAIAAAVLPGIAEEGKREPIPPSNDSYYYIFINSLRGAVAHNTSSVKLG